VKVHASILKLTAGGKNAIEEKEANEEIHHANEQYAQVRILLIPSFQIVNPPAGVNLLDGLDQYSDKLAGGKLQVTDEEAALLIPALRTPGTDDVELYFINFLSGGRGGEAFPASMVPDPRYEDSAIIAVNNYGAFTIPHEIGHVLMDTAPPECA